MTTVIVGVGVLATMSLFAACSQQNMNASEMTTAMDAGHQYPGGDGEHGLCRPNQRQDQRLARKAARR